MKVYVLSVGWSNYWEVGVFSSVELAMAARPDIEWEPTVRPKFRQTDRSWDGDGKDGPATITEHELDRPEHDR